MIMIFEPNLFGAHHCLPSFCMWLVNQLASHIFHILSKKISTSGMEYTVMK